MGDSSSLPQLPPAVEELLAAICIEQSQPPPEGGVRRRLAAVGEEEAVKILKIVRMSKIKKSLSGYIVYLAKKSSNGCSPSRVGSPASAPCSPLGSIPNTNLSKRLRVSEGPGSTSNARKPRRALDYSDEIACAIKDHFIESPSQCEEMATNQTPDSLLDEFETLGFLKGFLLLSYIGRHKLEDKVSIDKIRSLQHLPIDEFESCIWNDFGRHFCQENDRRKYLDRNNGRRYYFHCHVYADGSCSFKGPFLNKTTTHLQKVLGDENVLIVKFAEEETGNFYPVTGSSICCPAFNKVVEEGIFIGRRCYQFFVFKDGGKEEKKKNPNSNPVKCYFVHMEEFARFYNRRPYYIDKKSIDEARRLFMHIHKVSTLSDYVARFSLILSKTITLDVNLDGVDIQYIDDVPCQSEDGHYCYDKDGQKRKLTDGTGFISYDLALKCPNNCYKRSLHREENAERSVIQLQEASSESSRVTLQAGEPPLLIQFRMFHNGRAIKGTVLVNKKLPPRTITVRRSMIKVPTDELSGAPTVNSFEIVGTSNKPKKTRLSRNLIALLHYGGIPKAFFLDALSNAPTEAQKVLSNKRDAFRVALNRDYDEDSIAVRMIAAGIPLDEPFLQYHLSVLAKEERKSLKGGKLPIEDSYYVMGTADPTGTLNGDKVCVILDRGQLSGPVLVYRNPGVHPGDIHVLKATYVEEMKDFVGNSKFGIFFPAKGARSIGDEIAGGDYDGDMYWVSNNSQLLEHFRQTDPWVCASSPPKMASKKLSDLSPEQLERELFRLFMAARFNRSKTIGMAADSWLVFMDRLLTLGEDCAAEKNELMKKILKLVDIYYDALDAPKKGKKVVIPQELIPERYPHYMERGDYYTYKSTSILGVIYDEVDKIKEQVLRIPVRKLQCFEGEVPVDVLRLWEEHFDRHRYEMKDALISQDESKNDYAAQVYRKYRKELYGADDLVRRTKTWEEVKVGALAIYHIVYDYAAALGDTGKCRFAWKVAGDMLFELFAESSGQTHRTLWPSSLREFV